MAEETWGEYGKLVLKELERLNDDTSKLKTDMDNRFSEIKSKLSDINSKLSEIKNIEGKSDSNTRWIEKVNEIWSPTQMKEAKDELYKQQHRWVSVIAIFSFIQAAITIGISIWVKMK